MRAGQHAQCAVQFVGVVEMDPDGEHLLEKFDRGLDVGHAVLDAPWAKAGDFDAGAKRQRQVLVPRNQPIRAGRSIKLNGADRKRFRRKMRTNQAQQPLRPRQSGDSRKTENATRSSSRDYGCFNFAPVTRFLPKTQFFCNRRKAIPSGETFRDTVL